MRLLRAKLEHIEWIARFERSLAACHAGFDVEKIGRCDCCSMGAWLSGSNAFADNPGFAKLIELHEAFHEKAAGVAVAANRRSDLGPALGSMRAASASILAAVQELEE